MTTVRRIYRDNDLTLEWLLVNRNTNIIKVVVMVITGNDIVLVM